MKNRKNNIAIDFQIFDSHIHFGEFRNSFYAPESVNEILTNCGVLRYSAMLFPNKLHLNGERDNWLNFKMLEQNAQVDLILVVTPELLKEDPTLSILNTLPFKIIKLHGALHNWHPNGTAIHRVFTIAQNRTLPIMLHTGGRKNADAGSYLKICSEFPKVKVVLAHSRPLEETIYVMKSCPNVWADTSFLPVENIQSFLNEGLADRVLFGTDFPIAPLFSDGIDIQTWYEQNLSAVMSSIGLKSFKTIANINYLKFYTKSTDSNQ